MLLLKYIVLLYDQATKWISKAGINGLYDLERFQTIPCFYEKSGAMYFALVSLNFFIKKSA